MQAYRKLVRLFSDGDCDVKDIDEVEERVRDLGDRLVSKWKDRKSDEVVKARAIQLLRYVATYCETHHRAQVQQEFLVFIANCVEGMYDNIIHFFMFLVDDKNDNSQSVPVTPTKKRIQSASEDDKHMESLITACQEQEALYEKLLLEYGLVVYKED